MEKETGPFQGYCREHSTEMDFFRLKDAEYSVRWYACGCVYVKQPDSPPQLVHKFA
jgi:hypothetical protein